MVVDKPSCDYLRLATFEPDLYEALFNAVMSCMIDDARRPGRWLDYEGYYHSSNEAFCCQGEITSGKRKGEWHAVGHVSGELSNLLLEWDFPDEIYATRIDVQVTVPCPKDYNAITFKHKLEHKETEWTGRRRKPTLIHGPKGEGDSVYIGSRDSDKYIRVYEKFSKDGKKFLRFEVEFKRRKARSIYEYIKERRPSQAMAFVLMQELDKLPNIPPVDFIKVVLFLWSLQTQESRGQ